MWTNFFLKLTDLRITNPCLLIIAFLMIKFRAQLKATKRKSRTTTFPSEVLTHLNQLRSWHFSVSTNQSNLKASLTLSSPRYLFHEGLEIVQTTPFELEICGFLFFGRNMLNRSGNTTDNLCFRYRFRDVFSRFRCCVYNGTGPLFVHVKHNGNMELHVSATFQKYGNMWFRPVLVFRLKLLSCALCNFTNEGQQSSQPIVYKPLTSARNIFTSWNWAFVCFVC